MPSHSLFHSTTTQGDFRMKSLVAVAFFLSLSFLGLAQDTSYDGLENGLSNIYRLSNAKTRSISPENFTGEKGKGGMATQGTGAEPGSDLGVGWKISPSVNIGAGET